jgi:hypothetical protein
MHLQAVIAADFQNELRDDRGMVRGRVKPEREFLRRGPGKGNFRVREKPSERATNGGKAGVGLPHCKAIS